ncbi:MAG: hypothetical protein ACF8Q5_14450 [Phycisphaerales bacterium JB040]
MALTLGRPGLLRTGLRAGDLVVEDLVEASGGCDRPIVLAPDELALFRLELAGQLCLNLRPLVTEIRGRFYYGSDGGVRNRLIRT